MTYQDLIDETLQLAGITGPGDMLSSAQYPDLLRSLILLLDRWNSQKALTIREEAKTFTLTPGKNLYTIGTNPPPSPYTGVNPHITQARPAQVGIRGVITDGSGPNAVRFEIEKVSLDEMISYSPVDIPGTVWPQAFFYSPSYFNTNVGYFRFYPTPSQAVTFTCTFSGLYDSDTITLSTPLTLPAGIQSFIVDVFLLTVARKFKRPIDGVMIAQAQIAKQELRAAYSRSPVQTDTGRKRFNIFSGDYERVH